MTVFVIDIGKNLYNKNSLPLIEKLCDYNNVNLFVLNRNIKENIYNLHPSWLKLFSFNYVKDDFIISWDLDLVPTKLFNFKTYFNQNILNLSYDSSYIKENFTFNGKFKYNCGLIGLPSSYSEILQKIYIDKGQNSSYPSYEQYHINDKIYDENYKINLLNHNLNYMFDGDENFNNDVLNIHYTWKIQSNEHRIDLIDKHYKKYVNNFTL